MSGDTRVVLDAILRNCYFSLDRTPPSVPGPTLATGWVEIHHAGSSATAVVHPDAPNQPGTHYNVGLIEEPAAGVGTTTVQKGPGSGTTGVWVIVERPNRTRKVRPSTTRPNLWRRSS